MTPVSANMKDGKQRMYGMFVIILRNILIFSRLWWNKKFGTLFRFLFVKKNVFSMPSNASFGEKQCFFGREAMLCSPKSDARPKSLQIRAVWEKCSKSRILLVKTSTESATMLHKKRWSFGVRGDNIRNLNNICYRK